MGYERVDYSTVKRKTDETIKYENIIQKNLANREVLTDTIEKLKDVLENPSIETFENENNDDSNNCKFYIENKCYDQYVAADKNYYDTGASIFNSVFPTVDADIFKKKCYTITKWLSENMTYILTYKLIIGCLAAILYWSLNPNLDFQIRVFKSFIAFVFSEVYLLYNIYNHILKPSLIRHNSVSGV